MIVFGVIIFGVLSLLFGAIAWQSRNETERAGAWVLCGLSLAVVFVCTGVI
jgi:hypothetical protein